MVRSNRVKFYTFPGSPTLCGDTTNGEVDTYSDYPLNGRIQSIYFEAGDWAATGSIRISVSGTAGGVTATEGAILSGISGTTAGHHLGEDWIVFPRASTVTTNAVPIINYSGPSPAYTEIPIWSHIRVEAGIVGTGSMASGLTIIYI